MLSPKLNSKERWLKSVLKFFIKTLQSHGNIIEAIENNHSLWYPTRKAPLIAYHAARHATVLLNAAERIEQFTQIQSKYDTAMQDFIKMLSEDKKAGQEHQAIYPQKLGRISNSLVEGTLAYIKGAYDLAKDFLLYSNNEKFVKEYKMRLEYIEVIKEELQSAMTELKAALGHLSFYRIGLVAGENKINELLVKLTFAQDAMQRGMIRPRDTRASTLLN